jgi:hypothetical protein
MATPKILIRATGKNTFQQTFISWSTLSLGSVQRSHIIIKIKKNVLLIIQNTPQAGESINPEIGLCQPPRKHAAATALTTNIFAYSLKKKKA